MILLSSVSIVVLLLVVEPLLADRIDNQGAGHSPTVTLETSANGSLRLDAIQTPLAEVIRTVQRETGIEMHYSILPEALVTKSCTGTIEGLLKCLLGAEANLIYRYAETGGVESRSQPAEVWLLGSNDEHAGTDSGQEDILGCDGKTTQDQAWNASKESEDEARIGGQPLDETETVSLLNLAKSKDAWQRAQAVTRLALDGPANDANVTVTLEAALSDQDPVVRAQAISGLARRDGYQADTVLREALQDRNAEVRLMSVDSAGNDRSVLEAALNDNDETVRQLATMKLEQLSASDSLR